MWSHILQTVILGDLIINFFFHIVQLRGFCCHNNAIRHLGTRFAGVESRVGNVELESRRLQTGLSDRRIENGQTRVTGDVKKKEEID